MVRHGKANLLMILVLLLATALGGTRASSSSAPGTSAIAQASPQASPVPSDSILYEAVSPAYRDEVIAATDGQLSQYTIDAMLHVPGSVLDSIPDATPAATPLASPVTVPAASPIATPIADTMATPVGPNVTPVARPGPTSDGPPLTPTEQLATITGTQEVRFINVTGEPLAELYFRLYPNLRQYGEGRMVVQNVTVDDVPVVPELPPLYSVPNATPAATPDAGSGDLILVRLPLTTPLPANDSVTVRMAFTTTVPMASLEGPGVFAFTPETDTWALAHWFPILAGYDPISGWEMEPPAAWSDPVFSNTALFDVTLTVPQDLVLVTTGVEVEGQIEGKNQVRRFTSGPVRDFTIVASTDFELVSTEIGGTTITSYYNPQDAAGGAQILEWAAQSLAIFIDLFGPYPYTHLDLVAVPGVTGFEFPQMVFIGAEFYPDPVSLGSRPGAIEFLVAHEVSHQWWYGLTGNNQHRHAFLDEGLAEYSAVLYFEGQYGTDAAEAQLDAGLRLRYATMLLTNQDWVVDQPSVDFPDINTYFATVYRKGGLGFAALRQEIGDDAFFAGLHDYAETMRFGVANPDDLQVAFEEVTDRGLDDVWHLWFNSASGRVEIVMEAGGGTPAAATPVVSPVASPVPDGG